MLSLELIGARSTVLEPFCGSGTTLLAAEVEGFDCIASEMEPAYCDIIEARYSGWKQVEE